MTEHEDFKAMKAYFNITNKDIAEITGLSLNSIARSSSQKYYSRYFKLTVWVFKKMLREKIKE